VPIVSKKRKIQQAGYPEVVSRRNQSAKNPQLNHNELERSNCHPSFGSTTGSAAQYFRQEPWKNRKAISVISDPQACCEDSKARCSHASPGNEGSTDTESAVLIEGAKFSEAIHGNDRKNF